MNIPIGPVANWRDRGGARKERSASGPDLRQRGQPVARSGTQRWGPEKTAVAHQARENT